MHASHPCFQHITFFVRVGWSGVSVGGKAAKRTMPAVLSRDDAHVLADLDLEDQSVQHIAGLIRERLTAKLDRVVDVFHKLDVDGSGTIDGFEFSQALRGMGVREPGIGPCVGALFASLDVDGDGFIRYDELRGLLTRSSSSHPDLPPLPPNAANPIALRKERVQSNNANVLQGLDLDEDAMETIPQQIQAALQLNRARVIDVFRQFDDDGDTAVSRKEFRKALRELGLEVSKAAMDAVFDEMDLDGSGEIDFDDLRRTLNGEKRSAEAIAAQKRAAKKAADAKAAAAARATEARAAAEARAAEVKAAEAMAVAVEAKASGSPPRQKPTEASPRPTPRPEVLREYRDSLREYRERYGIGPSKAHSPRSSAASHAPSPRSQSSVDSRSYSASVCSTPLPSPRGGSSAQRVPLASETRAAIIQKLQQPPAGIGRGRPR